MSAVTSTHKVTTLLESWDAEFALPTTDLTTLLSKTINYQGSELNLIGLLRRLAEIVEQETEEWYKSDPDPFDDRHPSQADKDCVLGHVMKILFKNDLFMNKLVSSYLAGRDRALDELHVIASRLLLDIMPGLDASVTFQDNNDSVIKNLIEWSQKADEPLCSYATGILASAMEIQEILSTFKDDNATLVPLMLRRLQTLKEENQAQNMAIVSKNLSTKRHFKDISKDGENKKSSSKHSLTKNTKVHTSSDHDPNTSSCAMPNASSNNSSSSKVRGKRKKMTNGASDDEENGQAGVADGLGHNSRRASKRIKPSSPVRGASSAVAPPPIDDNQQMAIVIEDKKTSANHSSSAFDDVGNSNSCWADVEPMVISKFCMWPLSIEMRQRLILTYLQRMGEYQEFLPYTFELPVLDILFYYIDLKQNKDVRLAFEALKYLGTLLSHKKFAVDFILVGGIQKMLAVQRPSVAATGVAMCLYYLAYFEGVMERVCLLPHNTLVEVVSFTLWLLKCKHESGRVHATMFFGLTFPFRVIVDIFDTKGGLRMLYNVMSTLTILDVADAIVELTEDDLTTNRQSARHVTVAIRRYLETHLAYKCDQVRRSNARGEEDQATAGPPANKAVKFSPEMIQENVELLLECCPSKNDWKPVNDLIKLGALQTLVQLLCISEDWANYSGKVETLRSALDILSICCVVSRTKAMLCDSVRLPDNSSKPAVSILLSLASGQFVTEPEVQKAALNVIINAVCGPITKVNGVRMASGASRRRSGVSNVEDPLMKIWSAVRYNNGIMVLINLLNVKTPVTEADSIRVLACKALVGLSRCTTVKQIISKLPMFSNGQLQQLMWEPVLQDKRSEHVKFCRYAMQLIEQVSGKPPQGSVDPSLDRMRRADIVAQTKITFNSNELLQLVHDHLIKEGLHETASVLEREARLTLPTASSTTAAISQVTLNQTPKICKPSNAEPSFVTPRTPLSSFSAKTTTASNSNDATCRKLENSDNTDAVSTVVPATSCHTSAIIPSTSTPLPGVSRPQEWKEFATPSTPVGPASRMSLRKGLHVPTASSQQRHARQLQNMSCTKYENTPLGMSTCLQPFNSNTPAADQLSILSNMSYQKGSIFFESNNRNNDVLTNKAAIQAPPTPALSNIVTSYLQHQHANCKNPIVTCPTFSLLKPHHCPEPKNRRNAPLCMTARQFHKQVMPLYGGFEGLKYDRKYIFSRFRPLKSYRDSEGGIFSCCAFTADQRSLLLGTCTGDLKMFNIKSSEETYLSLCHEAPITHCEPSRDGTLVLTSSTWGSAMSALWRMNASFDAMYSFNEDEHVEFSKQTQDKIVGTYSGTANVYDVNTGTKLYSLFDAEKNNNYSRNRATFGPTDELVLNDGVLWDLESRKPIHKFDKFDPNISGVFHPNGMEVIINSQVWDVRTYHLLYTVEALDQCQIRFSKNGKIIYGAIYQMDDDLFDDPRAKNSFNSSFRTFDGTDYSSIATVDVKRAIYDLAADENDAYVAVVENSRQPDAMSEESVCRLYEIGRLKDSEDDQADDDEDDDQDGDEEEEDDDDDDTVTVAFDNDRNIRGDDEDDEDEDNDLLNNFMTDSESDYDIEDLIIDGDDDLDLDDDDDEDDDDVEARGVASRLRSRSRRRDDDDEEDDDDDDEEDNFYYELSDLSNF